MSGGGNLVPKFMPISISDVHFICEAFRERERKEMLAFPHHVLQACVSFFEVFQTRVAHCPFLPCSHTNAVTHMDSFT